MSTALTVRNSLGNSGAGVRFPNPLESIANSTTYKIANRTGKVFLIFYMPASSTFVITVNSVPDKFGRSENIVATVATAGANPEIRVLGPFTPGLFNQRSGADKDCVTFSIASLTGAVKVAALAG